VIRLPSLQRAVDCYFSGDPALKQPPVAPDKDASEESIAAYKSAFAEYDATLTACQETGQWAPLLIDGQVPLKFVLGQVDRTIWRSVIDRGALPNNNPRHIGTGALLSLLFRLALRDLVGADGVVVQRSSDSHWDGWVMAQPEIVTVLDAANHNIVSEIGGSVYRRLLGISPKS
jgi:hypothetical protein